MRETKRVGLRQRVAPDSDDDLRALFTEREQGVAGQLDRMEAAAVGVLLKAGLPGAVGSYAVARDGTWRDLPPGQVSDAGEVSVAHPALAASFDLTIEQNAAELLDALRWLRPWLDKSPEHRRAALHGLRVGQLARSLVLRELWEVRAESGIKAAAGGEKGRRASRDPVWAQILAADAELCERRPSLAGSKQGRAIELAKQFERSMRSIRRGLPTRR